MGKYNTPSLATENTCSKGDKKEQTLSNFGQFSVANDELRTYVTVQTRPVNCFGFIGIFIKFYYFNYSILLEMMKSLLTEFVI